MKKYGLIQIYTGDGKGKTTAAIGLAVRARGHNCKVAYVSFHKNPHKWQQGEYKILKKIGVDVYSFADNHSCFPKKKDHVSIRKQCLDGLNFIKQIYLKNKYDLLILDEIIGSLCGNFLAINEVVEILNLKPKNTELVLTGRGAPKKIINKADLVSKIKKIIHPFDSKINARKGIEY